MCSSDLSTSAPPSPRSRAGTPASSPSSPTIAPASAAGYALGILAHWLLSSRAVFSDQVAARGRRRTRQKALFVGSALVGLALTTAIVGTGTALGLDPRLAKLAAIAASFTATWLLREKLIFRNPDPSA